ncbi:MAG: hypothetical protein KKH98_15875 [Spirochaetes bacterium]|nr:hypothetical protein [Spirochaetota bacterium]
MINNNIMSEIDLYASAFPVQYGSATGAVIDINTLDEVKEFDGYTDLGLLSASFLIMSPFYSDDESSFNIAWPSYRHDPDKNDKKGYFIASARYGYFTLALRLVDLLIEDAPNIVPEYWDYQVKLKYYLGRSHSLSMLFFGSSDYLKLGLETDEEKARKEQEYNDDPLLLSIEFKTDQQFNTQGIYYTFEPSKRFQNTLMAYASLNRIRQYVFFEGENFPEALNGINIEAYPDIFGLKNKTRAEWWEDHGEIRIGLEYAFFKFIASGKSLYVYEGKAGQGAFQRGEADELFYTYELDEDIENELVGGYVENKFTFGGLQFVPGIRSDYLDRSRVSTIDPRYRISYEFPFQTTLSVSYGHYSYFFQVNPRNFNSNIDLAKLGSILKPERAIHRVVGLEQRIDLFTVKIETFLNDFFDRPRQFPHTEADGTFLPGLSSGRLETKGFEFLLRKDRRESSDGLFGWLSYTYTRAREKSNLPVEPGYAGVASNVVGDPYGDIWITSGNEQIHSLKITSGYIYGRSTFSAKFQFYTGRPYTPITASEFDEEYYNLSGVSRYLPIYGERNSARYDMFHQLDVRYSFKTFYSWGYVSWYIEIINVYNNIQKDQQDFDKTRPYQEGVNPVLKKPDTSLSLFPGFGVEIKF